MITDSQVVSNVRAQRRRAEMIRDLLASLKDDAQKWAEIVDLIPNDEGEIVVENREAEGVTTLSGAELYTFQAICEKFVASVNELGEIPLIHKLCVRRLLE